MNPFNKKTLFFAVGFLLFQLSFSQGNYLSGYVINLEKDTIKGFIDYKNWNANPDKINFKIRRDATSILYSTSSIVEFGVKDEMYISAIVNTETSPTQSNILQENSVLNFKLDTVFLQTLYKGSKDLYYYKSVKGKDNFYIKDGQSLELLIYKKYALLKFDERGRTTSVVKENKKYKGQLAHYLSDCSSIQSKLLNTGYSQESLEEIFKYYYTCSQNDIQFQKKKAKTAIEIGVLAGISSSKIEFIGDDFDYLTQAKFNQSTNFTAGLFLEIFFSRNRKKWSLHNELAFSSSKFKGQHESFRNETGEVKTTIILDYSYLKLNNLLRYHILLNQKSLRLFINGGISNGIAVGEKNCKKEERNFFGNESINEGKALDASRKYEQGYILGLGIKHKQLSFETRMEKGNGMSDYGRLSSPTTRLHFLFGYRF